MRYSFNLKTTMPNEWASPMSWCESTFFRCKWGCFLLLSSEPIRTEKSTASTVPWSPVCSDGSKPHPLLPNARGIPLDCVESWPDTPPSPLVWVWTNTVPVAPKGFSYPKFPVSCQITVLSAISFSFIQKSANTNFSDHFIVGRDFCAATAYHLCFYGHVWTHPLRGWWSKLME